MSMSVKFPALHLQLTTGGDYERLTQHFVLCIKKIIRRKPAIYTVQMTLPCRRDKNFRLGISR
jgi:hypothetical protein